VRLLLVATLATLAIFNGPRTWLWEYEGIVRPPPSAIIKPVFIPEVSAKVATPQSPPPVSGGSQLYANDCVPAAFARAAGLNFTTLYSVINDLYLARALDNVPQEVYDYSPDAYPFDVLRMTPVNVIRAMNVLGYNVIATQAFPDVLQSIPRGSVFITPGWGHAYNIVSYNQATDTLVVFGGLRNETFRMADYAVMRRVGQPTENLPDVLAYPDVYIVGK